MRYAVIAVILLVVAVVYVLVIRKQRRGATGKRTAASNVIPLDRHRKPKNQSGDQPCSSCKKKNGKLIFYAQDNGTVIGLCKDCRGKAKKQDLLPL